ncbi:peptidoglycan DD-metalloendopeptidase family protein [Pseudomonas sp. F1_0610]|uniref:peptidoglycan DD-metalloendopeptidase family protein n=1 Tax=Pseudomonas sp. F1_0610 TaxID=3114284 RepID=UPI0039C4E455
MITKTPIAKRYTKNQLLVAGSIFALVGLSLLIYPSQDVEAKKTFSNLNLDTSELDTENFSQALSLEDLLNQPHFAKKASPISETFIPGINATNFHINSVLPTNKVVKLTINSGDTLSSMFNQAGLTNSTMYKVLNSHKEAKAFSRLNAGQELVFELSPEGDLISLSIALNKLESISAVKDPETDNFKFAKDVIVPEIEKQYTRGVIHSSLMGASKEANLPYSTTLALANIFGYDIDFAQDIRSGDEFELIYEKKTVNGQMVGAGKILAARFVNKGKEYTAIRYADSHGIASYYTAEGRSMRKAFIRTPVEFSRISSRFNPGRRHPVLNKIRAHKGVDYAAPTGTPIVATGNGTVIHAGWRGGYGNTVIIKHGNSYQTLYAHMKNIAKGLKSGSRVTQGQVVGYVGMTGLATGPHLHYEFQVNGTHVDPLSQKLPTADPLNSKELARFKTISQPLMAQMDTERKTMLAKASTEEAAELDLEE